MGGGGDEEEEQEVSDGSLNHVGHVRVAREFSMIKVQVSQVEGKHHYFLFFIIFFSLSQNFLFSN